ncbi:MAG: adenylate/guanylate cyclase domain-containing protein [Spirochaetia bacterium]|nr:adenylate/guanylate cyclase domain-containing protein [Spirochaetia bacterium]
MTILYVGAGYGVRNEIPAHSLQSIYVLAVISFSYAAAMLFLTRAERYRPFMKYVSSGLDVVVLTAALYAFGSFRTFKTEAFLIYFLWIALAAMRFSVKLTLFTGGLSVLAYSFVIAAAIFQETIVTGSITEHFTSSRVSPLNLGLRLAFLTASFSVAAYVARLYRGLVTQSVTSELEAERSAREKEVVRETLSRYVSPLVADKILAEGRSLTSERKAATILFCDIRGFTRVSETMEPEEVVSFLNDYLERMVDVIFEHGGTLDKFVGDEIMAVYGVPVSSGRDEEMAVLSALKMKMVLADMNKRREAQGKDPVRFGIGIHTGDVVAGNIGSEKRMEFTVIGHAVNVARRVEALNKFLETDLLLTESTYERVQGLVEVEKQKLVRVKGIEEPIQTFRVVGRRSH